MHKQANKTNKPSRQAKKRTSAECDLNNTDSGCSTSSKHRCQETESDYFSTKRDDDQNRLGRDFYSKPCVTLAKDLLGQTLVRVLESGEKLSGRIVETEAYCGKDDAACHSYKGRRSEKNKGMFMEAGNTYVYMIYGMYHCLNISSEGEGTAVLIRALDPIEGVSKMQTHRQRRRKETSKPLKHHQLCSGPGKLTDAFFITKSLDQIDLVKCPYMWIEKGETLIDKEEIVDTEDGSKDKEDGSKDKEDGSKDKEDASKDKIISCPRIGIDSVEVTWRLKPLRFYIRDNKSVSVRNKQAEDNN